MMQRTILLTGVTGFLGSHLLKALAAESNYDIICLKRSFSDMRRITNVSTNNVKFFDVDNGKIESVFCENHVDLIVHMATEYGRDNPVSKVLEANLVFPIKLVEFAIKYNTNCFINTDSYFNKENLSYNYLLNYSLSKKSFVNWLKSFSSEIGIVNVVLEHIFGENDNPGKFTEYTIRNIAINKINEIKLTHGHQRRDFIYVKDVVNAYKYIIDYALTRGKGFKTFEVGKGESIELRAFVEAIKELSGSDTILNFGAIPYRCDEIMDSKANTKDLIKLGWRSEFSIEAGISRIISIYKSNTQFIK